MFSRPAAPLAVEWTRGEAAATSALADGEAFARAAFAEFWPRPPGPARPGRVVRWVKRGEAPAPPTEDERVEDEIADFALYGRGPRVEPHRIKRFVRSRRAEEAWLHRRVLDEVRRGEALVVAARLPHGAAVLVLRFLMFGTRERREAADAARALATWPPPLCGSCARCDEREWTCPARWAPARVGMGFEGVCRNAFAECAYLTARGEPGYTGVPLSVFEGGHDSSERSLVWLPHGWNAMMKQGATAGERAWGVFAYVGAREAAEHRYAAWEAWVAHRRGLAWYDRRPW